MLCYKHHHHLILQSLIPLPFASKPKHSTHSLARPSCIPHDLCCTPRLQEVASQQQQEQGSSAPLMNKDMLDLIFVNRLIESPPELYPQPPFQYLLGCFARAVNELRSVSPRHPPEVQQHLQGVIAACKELLVSYAALILTGSGVVPEVRVAAQAQVHTQL